MNPEEDQMRQFMENQQMLNAPEKQRELAGQYLDLVDEYERILSQGGQVSKSIDEMEVTLSPQSMIDEAVQKREELFIKGQDIMREYGNIFVNLNSETRERYLTKGAPDPRK